MNNTEAPTYFTGKHAVSMELRDYFAAKAMQAYIPDAIQKSALMKDVATEAYWYADEMLKAREK